jgi:hypothetical protein
LEAGKEPIRKTNRESEPRFDKGELHKTCAGFSWRTDNLTSGHPGRTTGLVEQHCLKLDWEAPKGRMAHF